MISVKPMKLSVLLICFLIFVMVFHFDLSKQLAYYLKEGDLGKQLREKIEQQKIFVQTDESSRLSSIDHQMTNDSLFFIKPENFNTFFKSIMVKGKNDNVTFVQVHPLPFVKKDFYKEMPIKIEIVGSYQSLLRFLGQTSAVTPIFSWGNWMISRQKNAFSDLPDDNNPILILTTTACFYFLDT